MKIKSVRWVLLLMFCIPGFLSLVACSSTTSFKGFDKLSGIHTKAKSQNDPPDNEADNGASSDGHRVTCYLVSKCYSSEDARKEKQISSGTGYSDQQRLDDALELCEESQKLWKKGQVDEALEALDQSYTLVLNVRSEADKPELSQQRDDLRYLIAKRIIEIYSSRAKVKLGKNRAIPLVLNSYVQREIKLFQNGERKFFLDAYRRSGCYRPYIQRELKNAGLPEQLSWLPLIESGFRTKALSRARALGPWQFIASTGYRFGLKRDRWVDERMDIIASTRAAIDYLKALHDLFGDWTTALAAYNCGEFNVMHAIKSQHVNYLDNFWDLYPRLPFETARYVPKFLAVLNIVNNPDKFGFVLPPVDPPIKYETVKINKQVKVSSIAQKAGIQYSLLKKLNPALRYNVTPAYPYDLKIPPACGENVLAHMDEIPVWKPKYAYRGSGYIRHRLRRGETLSALASRYRTSWRRIMAINKIRNPRHIRMGKVLKIPVGRRRFRTRRRYKTIKGKKRIRYTIKRGDTLWELARTYNVSVQRLKRINGLDSNSLKPGQVIRIYTN